MLPHKRLRLKLEFLHRELKLGYDCFLRGHSGLQRREPGRGFLCGPVLPLPLVNEVVKTLEFYRAGLKSLDKLPPPQAGDILERQAEIDALLQVLHYDDYLLTLKLTQVLLIPPAGFNFNLSVNSTTPNNTKMTTNIMHFNHNRKLHSILPSALLLFRPADQPSF